MNTTKTTIKKWYERLSFPEKYDDAFYGALESIIVSPDATLDAYDKTSEDGLKNLLHYLYFCEATERLYEEKGLPKEILFDTLSDIVIWTEIWSDVKGTLYLGELPWLALHLSARLFKVGRLQYAFPPARDGVVPQTVEVHIPAVGPLLPEDASRSLDAARAFFDAFFPEYEYDRFTCDSWLLDETLKKYLKPESNIVRFGDLFTRVSEVAANSVMKYVLGWGVTTETLKDAPTTSSFAARVKDAILGGETFHRTFGYILK